MEIRLSWDKLKASFLVYYTITEKDAEQRMFETRMRLHSLKQEDDEHIAEYLRRAEDLSIKMPSDLKEVGMATLKGMRESTKKDQITYTCNSEANWTFSNVVRLVKSAYSKIGDTNPWDPNCKDLTKIVLNQGATTDELLRQALLQSSNTLPALLQGIRSITSTQGRIFPQSNQVQARTRDRSRDQQAPRGKKDLSHIQCFKCEEYGHYANDCPTNQGAPRPTNPKPPAMSAFVDIESDDDYSDTAPNVPARVLTIYEDHQGSDEEPKATMAATKDKAQASSSKQPEMLRRPKGVQKRSNLSHTTLRHSLHTFVEQIEAYNRQQGYHPPAVNDNEPDDNAEEMDTQATLPNQPTDTTCRPLREGQGRMNQAPQTRITKTGKVQELVTSHPPKRPNPIRGMMGKLRLTSDRLFENQVSFTIGELLDASDDLVKDMAYGHAAGYSEVSSAKACKAI